MLPLFLIDSLRKYKGDTTEFLTWLAQTGQKCGYPLAPKPNLKASRQKTKEASGDSVQEIPTHTLDIKDIVPLAQTVAAAPKKLRKIPASIKEVLARAIENRERCNLWFQKHHKEAPTASDGDRQHLHFIDVLRETLKTLAAGPGPLPADTEPETAVLTNMFEHLTVEQILDDEINLLRTNELSIETASSSVQKPKSGPKETVYTVKEANNDSRMAVYCLIQDFGRLRDFLKQTWQLRQLKKISSFSASMATNAAMEFARNLEIKVIDACDDLDCWEQAMKLFGMDDSLEASTGQAREHAVETPEVDGFNYVHITLTLIQFREYNDCDEFDDLLNNDAYPDTVGNLIERNFLSMYRRMLSEGTARGIDLLTQGLRTILSERIVSLWMVFAWQIFLDIHSIIGEHIGSGLEDIQTTGKRIQDILGRYYQYSQLMQPALDEQNAIRLKRLYDLSEVYAKDHDVKASKDFFLFQHHPWSCGLAEGTLKLSFNAMGRGLGDHLSIVMSSAHLYNVLRQSEELAMPWPAMEGLIKHYTPETIFGGPRPVELHECLRRAALAEGGSATLFAKNPRQMQSFKSKKGRRHIDVENPVREMLSNRYLINEDGIVQTEIDQDLIEAIVCKFPTGKNNKSRNGKLRKQWETSRQLGPVQLLTLLREAIAEAEPELEFAYFGAHRRGWQILRRVHTEIEADWAEYWPEKRLLDTVIHGIPLLLMLRYADQMGGHTPSGRELMAKAGKVVQAYISEEESGIDAAE